MPGMNDAINRMSNTDEGVSMGSKSSSLLSGIKGFEDTLDNLDKQFKIHFKINELLEKRAKLLEDHSESSQEIVDLDIELGKQYELEASHLNKIIKKVEERYYAQASFEEKALIKKKEANKLEDDAEKKRLEAISKRALMESAEGAEKMRLLNEAMKLEAESNALKSGSDRANRQASRMQRMAELESQIAQRKGQDPATASVKQLEKLAKHAETAEEKAELEAEAEEQRQIEQLEAQERAREDNKKALKEIGKSIVAAIDKVGGIADAIAEDTAKYASRLQGYSTTYLKAIDKINSTIGLSPFVKQSEVVKNLNVLLERGIAYNIEQRSFLATVSDKVAATFDKQNETLERLIRIQQADSTAARLGLEASLTRLFNEQYEDTSYLASNLFDQVTTALIEAESQMTKEQAVEFEYTIQKWLGSLSSLGLSSNAVTGIATGLGQLASGNISALNGTPLQTLFALSSSRAGLSYSDMLINSIDGSSVNALMKAMVEYLKEIAEGSNQVVKSAYGGIFNLTQSDFRALSNITSRDIINISNLSSTFDTATNEVRNQLTSENLLSRTSMAELVNNVINNFEYTWASDIASSPITMGLRRLNDIINQGTGGSGIRIPWITTMFGGFGLDMSLNNLIVMGMEALSLLSSIPDIISGFNNGGGLNLDAWGARETTSRGSGFKGIKSGFRSGTSLSQYVASGSTSDMESGTLESASSKGKDVQQQLGTEDKSNKDFNKSDALFDDLFKTPTYGMRAFLSGYTTDNAVRAYVDFKSIATVEPFSTIIANQQTTIDRLSTNNKDSALAQIYSLLNSKIVPNIGKSGSAKVTVDTSDLTNKLANVISTAIMGDVDDPESPYEVTLKEVLSAIYGQITSGGMRVDVRNVDRNVPGFGGMQAIRVKEIL